MAAPTNKATKKADKPSRTLGAIHEIPLNEIEKIATSKPGQSARTTIYDKPIAELPEGVARFLEETESVSTQALGLGLHAAAKRFKGLGRSDDTPLTTRQGMKDGKKGVIYFWTPKGESATKEK